MIIWYTITVNLLILQATSTKKIKKFAVKIKRNVASL